MKDNAPAEKIVRCLAAAPEGLSAPELRAALRSKISQPTLSRRLMALRARGEVIQVGKARATRYLLAGGRLRVAELRSQALHRKVAEKLVAQPGLKSAALARLDRLRELNPASAIYLERWRELLLDDDVQLLRAMTQSGETSDGYARPRLSPRCFRKRNAKGFSRHMRQGVASNGYTSFQQPESCGCC